MKDKTEKPVKATAKKKAPDKKAVDQKTVKVTTTKTKSKKPVVIDLSDDQVQSPVVIATPLKMPKPEFSRKTLKFIDEYPLDLNGTQAAIRAKFSPKTAQEQASRLLSNVMVRAAIDKKLAEAAKRNELDVDKVLQKWKKLAEHDSRELVEYRRVCCRHCHGPDFAYMETKAENARRKRMYDDELAKWEDINEDGHGKTKKRKPLWDDTRVIGYDARKPINPDCPECFGEGEGRAFFKDTRELSEAAVMAYAGVKIGKDGIEIKMADKTDALDKISRHLGFYEKDNTFKGTLTIDKAEMDARFASKMQASRERMKKTLQERGVDDE